MDTFSNFSNERLARANAKQYIGDSFRNEYFAKSTRANKKYMVFNPADHKWSHFGATGFTDYTKHKDLGRRANYLDRSGGIAGDWKNNKYSPNSLARGILWR